MRATKWRKKGPARIPAAAAGVEAAFGSCKAALQVDVLRLKTHDYGEFQKLGKKLYKPFKPEQ